MKSKNVLNQDTKGKRKDKRSANRYHLKDRKSSIVKDESDNSRIIEKYIGNS